MIAIERLDQENLVRQRVAEKEEVRQRVDKEGNRWMKVYFGSGAHFRNWLDQAIELKGKQNVKVEEADSRGFRCYEENGEKTYRIWVRENNKHEKEREIW
jgi:hypothetical protein